MNKRASIPLAILISVVFFMFGMMIMGLIRDDVTRARNADNLNCASPDTSGDMFTCLIIDGLIPYFIIAILSAGGGYLVDSVFK